ncbi:MAG: hypothetical protein QF561_05250 [Phycisphaerales bacterium]|nr:hypothetical protein [Phycisphaerales bacterium]
MAPISLILTVLAVTEPAHLIPSDGATNDIFGASVALAGPHLLAGAPIHGDAGYQAGAVYAFERIGSQWQQVQEILPPTETPYGEFGAAVAMQGDLAAVGWMGAMSGEARTGKVVLYEWTGAEWTQSGVLSDPDGEDGDRFGASICIDGTQMIIGCQLDDAAGWNSGSALVFRLMDGTWVFEQRLLPSQADQFSWAGRDVQIDGDIAILGAYLEWNGEDQAAGAAYAFHRTANGLWEEEARLTADDPIAGNYFGYSLSLDGTRLAIGSILNDAPIEDSGAVYLFDRDGGSWPQTKLSPPDVGGEFGYDVVLRGDDLLIGSVYHAGHGFATGAVYRFEYAANGWQWQGKWLPLPGADDCFFGSSISLDDDRVAVGSPREDIAGPWSGAVYVFGLDADCPADVSGDVIVGVDDLLAVVSAWGPCGGCLEDINGDGVVGADDVLAVIADWGWCH